MNEPSQEQMREFWEWCGFKYYDTASKWGNLSLSHWVYPDGAHFSVPPSIDLNNLFKWGVLNRKVPIVGVYFRYFPGGTECEITYMTEAGFDSEKSWIQAESKQADYDGEAFKLSALALFWAMSKARRFQPQAAQGETGLGVRRSNLGG